MKVVHVIASTATEFGGPPRVALDLARLSAAKGISTAIVTPDPREAPAHWPTSWDGSVAALPSVVTMRDIAHGAEIARGADVVHFHGVFNTMFVKLAKVLRAQGTPYIVTVHGMLDDWSMAQKQWKKRAYLMLGGRAFLEKAAFVHCTAQGELDQSKKWFPNGREVVIPYLIDTQPYRELPGEAMAREKWAFLNDDSLVSVLFLSRLHYKKGPDVLIDAIALAKAKGAKVRLVLAGDGDAPYPEQLKQQVATRGILDITHFVGQVSGALKYSLYQVCDLFALPTSQENFGLVYTESLASGTPVITTRGTDIWRELESSGGVKIVERSADAFANAIVELAGNASLREKMGSGAPGWVLRTYDEGMLLGKFVSVYERAGKS
ncbi:MAG: glycosyltransferase [Phycisphaerales bacterium]